MSQAEEPSFETEEKALPTPWTPEQEASFAAKLRHFALMQENSTRVEFNEMVNPSSKGN